MVLYPIAAFHHLSIYIISTWQKNILDNSSGGMCALKKAKDKNKSNNIK